MPDVLWDLHELCVPNRIAPLSTQIRAGCTAVLGPSGSGKSSLMQVLAGFLRPQSGTLWQQGTAAWMPQDLGLWPSCTVQEHLRAASNKPQRIQEWMEVLGLAALADKRPAALSGGEQARCSLARALVSPAKTLLLDEALAHIGSQQAEQYWDLILEHVRRENRNLVFVDHLPERALRAGGHVLCLDAGHLAYQGSVSALYEQPPSPGLMSCLGAGFWLSREQAERWGPVNAGALRPHHLRLTPSPEGPLLVLSSDAIGPLWRIQVRDRQENTTFTFCSSHPAPTATCCRLATPGELT